MLCICASNCVYVCVSGLRSSEWSVKTADKLRTSHARINLLPLTPVSFASNWSYEARRTLCKICPERGMKKNHKHFENYSALRKDRDTKVMCRGIKELIQRSHHTKATKRNHSRQREPQCKERQETAGQGQGKTVTSQTVREVRRSD